MKIGIIHQSARFIRHKDAPVLIAINRRASRHNGYALIATLSLMK